MAWELDADRPIYAQLVERIQKEIVSGKYQPGEKLPSVRTVTEDTELIGNTREQLAAGHVRNFINNMQELGYQREEIRNLFDKVQA